MEVYGELIRAQMENKTSDHSVSVVGMLWWRTDLSQARFSDGTIATNLLANNAKCIFGTHATPANNIRFHRGANGVLQFVTADDTTSEETLSTSIAQISFRAENYATVALPAAGIAGRVAFDSSLSKLKVDTGVSWETLEAGLETNIKNYVLAENLTAGDLVGLDESGELTQAYFSSASFGTAVDFYGFQIEKYSVCYDTVNHKVVVCFIDNATSYPKCMVGEIDGDTITYGTAVTIASAVTEAIACCYDSHNEKVIICYTDGIGAAKTGEAVAGTVSGTTISIGTPATFSTNETIKFDCSYDSTYQAFVIAFVDELAPNHGFAIKGFISSGEVSFAGSSPINYKAGSAVVSVSCAFNSEINETMIALAADDATTDVVEIAMANASGTVITIDQAAVSINKGGGGVLVNVGVTFDPYQNIAILTYSDSTTTTGYIAAYKIFSGGTSLELDEESFSVTEPVNNSLIFDTLNKKFALTYAVINGGTEGPGEIMLGEVMDDKIVLGTGVQYIANVATSSYGVIPNGLVFDDFHGRYAVLFHDYDDSELVKSTILNPLTPYQIIGILNTTGTIGQTKDVSLMGAISGSFAGKDPGRKGYVQANLTINYKKTNFPFGQFVSATELLLGRGE